MPGAHNKSALRKAGGNKNRMMKPVKNKKPTARPKAARAKRRARKRAY